MVRCAWGVAGGCCCFSPLGRLVGPGRQLFCSNTKRAVVEEAVDGSRVGGRRTVVVCAGWVVAGAGWMAVVGVNGGGCRGQEGRFRKSPEGALGMLFGLAPRTGRPTFEKAALGRPMRRRRAERHECASAETGAMSWMSSS